jgi:hypothetical protein
MPRRKPRASPEDIARLLALLKRAEPRVKRVGVLSYDPEVVRLLDLPKRSRPNTVKRALKTVFRTRCKPCWELKYCPYGPLVEQFPLPQTIRADAIKHNEFLKQNLKKGAFKGWRKKEFSADVKNFNPRSYPEQIPEEEDFMSCHIFGHYCPVFFVGEPFTESGDLRRGGDSSISFQTKLRVARRDNYTCQECGKLLREYELEFDHKIPRALGGTSEEHNIRLTCLKCNRKKGKQVQI